jgi:capsid protein
MANDLDDLMTAELDASKAAARYLAFVKTPDPMMRQAAVGAYSDAAGKKIEDLEHAIIEYLRPGEEVTFAKSDRPGVNFPPFVRLVLTMFSIVSGAPYELISGDYQGLNFSTAKINRNDFANFLRPVASRHIRHFGMRTLSAWMTAAAGSGALDLPGFFAEPDRYLDSRWQPPGMEPVDPLREVKSNIDEMGVLLRAPQEITEARGRDYEEVLDDIKDAKDLARERGLELVLAPPSTAQKNNPAAVEGQKSAYEIATLVRSILSDERLLTEGHA